MTSKAMQLTMEDLGKRFQSVIPTWILGTGADFGSLQPYSRHLTLTLLVHIFYQELTDDVHRTKENLVESMLEIAKQLRLSCTNAEAVKVVESLLVSSGKHFTFSFEVPYFDVESDTWKPFQYRYLDLDRDASDLDVGHQVYKLSEESQELVLKSLEVIEETDIQLQAIVAELLVTKGNLKSAMRMLQALDVRVRKLISLEKEHTEELIRHPKQTIYTNKRRWGNQLEEVQAQFQEEIQRYNQMERVLKKLEVLEEQRPLCNQLKNQITRTRNLHDTLAGHVIENIRIELEIRSSQFESMWLSSVRSFRQTIWIETIQQHGLAHPDEMLHLAECVFSPQKPFLLPLQWGIDEHSMYQSHKMFDTTKKQKEEAPLPPISLDWDSILSLWEPAMRNLLKEGYLTMSWLQERDEFTLARWLEHKEAFDFWVAFSSMEEPFIIHKETLQDASNDRVILINKLIEKDSFFNNLLGKQLYAKRTKKLDVRLKGKVEVSPYFLVLEDYIEHDKQ